MKRHTLYISVLLALALAGCQKDVQVEGPSAFVRFNPTIAPAEAQTKAGAGESVTEGVLATEDGTLSIPVSCEESVGRDGYEAVDETATKGALIGGTGTGSAAFSTGMTFNVTAWDNATTPARVIPAASSSTTSDVVSYSDSEWTTATEYKWEKDAVMTFYAYANLPSATGAASVTCTSAAGQTLSYDVTKVISASAQTDILLGFYKGDSKTGSPAEMTGTASVVFSHPLAAVQFKLGTVKGVTTFAVNGISIEGVYASGTASMTASSSGGIEWTSESGSTTVSQTVSTQPTTSKPQIGESFLLIPQTFASTSTARIVLNCKINGTDRVLYYPLASTQWKTGYCYTYTVGYDASTYSYSFTSDVSELSFKNSTSASSPSAVEISSTSQRTGEAATEADWVIKSVKVGSADPVSVGETSFTNIGGLSATKDGSNLKVTALARTPYNTGSNDYWRNQNPVRTDNLDWSPADWSSTKATDSNPIDLSRFNFQTESTDNPMTTANCYVIRHAGTYKIPLVYGNGIVDGAFNEQAYKPTLATGNSDTYFMSPFLNHLDKGIISPFIEYNTTDGEAYSAGSNSYLAPASGTSGYEIVWQDIAEIITINGISKEEVKVKNASGIAQTFNISYLTFTIPQNLICQNNAILAVKDGSGKVMWSWHIWTTNDPALLKGSIPVFNHDDVEYDFFPVYCLGWVDATNYPARDEVLITLAQKKSGNEIEITVDQPVILGKSNGTFYQWGRKDPMPVKDNADFQKSNTGPVSISTAICNPDTFFYPASSSTLIWYSNSNCNNLWTGRMTTTGKFNQSDDVIKTVYDPSPAGYKMPASNACTGFTTTGTTATAAASLNVEGSFGNGYAFYTSPSKTSTIFFVAAGKRDRTNGAVSKVGDEGWYWDSFRDSNTGWSIFYLASGNVNLGYSPYSANALSVRPVKE